MGGGPTRESPTSSYSSILEQLEEKAATFELTQEEICECVVDILSINVLGLEQLITIRSHLNLVLCEKIKKSGLELTVSWEKLGLEKANVQLEELSRVQQMQEEKEAFRYEMNGTTNPIPNFEEIMRKKNAEYAASLLVSRKENQECVGSMYYPPPN
jgi:hypothetical protein